MAKTKKQRVAEYFGKHPDAKIADVVKACKVSSPTVSIVKKELGLTRPRAGGKKKPRRNAVGRSSGGEELVLTRLELAAHLMAAAGSSDQAKRDIDTAIELKGRLDRV